MKVNHRGSTRGRLRDVASFVPRTNNNLPYHAQNFLSSTLYQEIILSAYEHQENDVYYLIYRVPKEHHLFIDTAWIHARLDPEDPAGANRVTLAMYHPDTPTYAIIGNALFDVLLHVWYQSSTTLFVGYGDWRSWPGFLSYEEDYVLGYFASGAWPYVSYHIHGWLLSERALNDMRIFIEQNRAREVM